MSMATVVLPERDEGDLLEGHARVARRGGPDAGGGVAGLRTGDKPEQHPGLLASGRRCSHRATEEWSTQCQSSMTRRSGCRWASCSNSWRMLRNT